MHDDHGQPVEVSEESKALGYEVGDISVPILLKWGLGLIIFFVITSGITLGIYALLITYRHEEKPLFSSQPGDAAPADAMRNAGMPVVQGFPIPDIKGFRATEDARVAGYGTWLDADGKTATRIPIDRAMQILMQRGLPDVKAGGTMAVRTNTNAVTPAPGQPGSGSPNQAMPPTIQDRNGLHNPPPQPPIQGMPAPLSGGTPGRNGQQ